MQVQFGGSRGHSELSKVIIREGDEVITGRWEPLSLLKMRLVEE